jgi:hypothetical protein
LIKILEKNLNRKYKAINITPSKHHLIQPKLLKIILKFLPDESIEKANQTCWENMSNMKTFAGVKDDSFDLDSLENQANYYLNQQENNPSSPIVVQKKTVNFFFH